MSKEEVTQRFRTTKLTDLKQLRKEIKQWADINLLGKVVRIHGFDRQIEFTQKGIKDSINSPHDFYIEKLNLFYQIEDLIVDAKFICDNRDIKNNQMVKRYYYFLIRYWDIDFFVVIRELINGKCYFYSITDKIKMDNSNISIR